MFPKFRKKHTRWQKFIFHPIWNYSLKSYWPPSEELWFLGHCSFPGLNEFGISPDKWVESSNHFIREHFLVWYYLNPAYSSIAKDWSDGGDEDDDSGSEVVHLC